MKAKLEPTITANINIVLTEMEARALRGMISYGPDKFLNMFYLHLGKAYLEDYEDGLRSFFKGVVDIINPQLSRIDRAREALK